MNWWIFGLLLGNAIGWVGAFLVSMENDKLRKKVAYYQKRYENEKTPDDKLAGETYGHPRPPVGALYEALPAPPTDHAWELAVEPVQLARHEGLDGGSYDVIDVPSLQLTCRLIKLTAPEDQKVIATRSADLIWKGWYIYSEGDAWAKTYREYSDKDQMFKKYFLDPFTDWANGYCDTINAATYALNPGAEYRMKGA